jgi:hypothetical protein
MKLYHLSQNISKGYDTHSDIVVCAKDEDAAKAINPSGDVFPGGDWLDASWNTWAKNPKQVTAKYLGEADDSIEEGVICASFHAG